MHSEPTIAVIQPEIDIISLKMLNVLGCDTANFTFKVRRRLFGGCDETHVTSLTDTLSEIENNDVQRSSQTWNFDFSTESPLPAGRYAWERVRNCDVPRWYTSENGAIHKERLCIVPQNIKDKCTESAKLVPKDIDMDECEQTAKSDQENNVKSSCRRQRYVQTHIKGYAKVQKKRTHKRPYSKNNSFHLVKGPHRVANYILRNQDDSTIS